MTTSNLTPEALETLRHQAEEALANATDEQTLEAWRIEYLGRSGTIPNLLRQIKDLSAEDKKTIGQLGNRIRHQLEAAYQQKKQELTEEENSYKLKAKDYKLPLGSGHLHPISQATQQVQSIFAAMGFLIVEGPDIEEAKYNFDNLNIPLQHPARAETDTFYIKDHPDLVLRTHVSPLQSRAVFEHKLKPPYRTVYYGPSYRAEKEDATHGAVFQQYEFMVVEEQVNLTHLKAIIQEFYTKFFGREMDIRFRPAYFPFVEPGLEVDMRDKVTKKSSWLEMAGAGMVHPNVLKNLNIDPEKYQGIALGGGLDRLVMLKYGIPDIRLMYSGDIRFLKQFS